MSDLSGYVGRATVDSLPREVRERWALNARLLEGAMRPGRITESAGHRQVAGLPMDIRTSAGGQSVLATVNTLAVQGGQPPSVGPGFAPAPIDRWDVNRMQESMFRNFFAETVTGRNRVTERWPGPMAGGDPTALGMYDYSGDGFHRIGQGRSRNVKGFQYGPRPGKRDWRSRDVNTIMPSIYGPDAEAEDSGVAIGRKYRAWDDDEEEEAESYREHRRALAEVAARRRALEPKDEEKEDRLRRHTGLACEKAHGILPHSAWMNLLRRGK